MKMNIQRQILLFTLLATTGSAASAALISIHADNYAIGTDISAMGPHATMSTFTNQGGLGLRHDPVVVQFNGFNREAAQHALGFYKVNGNPQTLFQNTTFRGAERCLHTGECDEDHFHQFSALYVAFTAPTDYVGVRVHNPDSGYDGTYLRAYDASGNILASCYIWGSSSNGRNPTSGVSPYLGNPDCGKVERRYEDVCDFTNCAVDAFGFISVPNGNIAYVMYGTESINSSWSSISHFEYRTVPEPGPIGLLATGGLLAVLSRRRRAPG